ncbi:MAG: site-2 protease family protein [Endomicrobium sp.]|nr:site-2 protease family protein [Endomicrobium sp.]
MNFQRILIYLPILIFSFMMHEIGHAYMADLRGDDTARRLGRITLNPIPHLDVFGSLIFPAMLLFMNSHFLFAWAKPVPFNPANLKNPRIDIPLIAFAGPFVHILLIAASFILLKLSVVFSQFTMGFAQSIIEFLYIMIQVNMVLFVFNLLPIPPLDGSKIISYFLPKDIAEKYMGMNQYVGFIILIVLISSGFLSQILSLFTGWTNWIFFRVLGY